MRNRLGSAVVDGMGALYIVLVDSKIEMSEGYCLVANIIHHLVPRSAFKLNACQTSTQTPIATVTYLQIQNVNVCVPVPVPYYRYISTPRGPKLNRYTHGCGVHHMPHRVNNLRTRGNEEN